MPVLTFKQYAEVEAVNFTTLKVIDKSPKHYRDALENPPPDSIGRLKGRGTHTATLEIERFMLDYACYKPEPGKKAIRRGKRWDAFKELHAEDNILTQAEYEHCIRASKAVKDDEVSGPIIARSQKEVSLTWTDEDTGILCKARLDLLADDGIYDLKGVRSADLRAVNYEIAKHKYYCQLAFYQEGVKRALGKTLGASIIGVENTRPHGVVVADISEDDLYAGWETVRGWLDKVYQCRKSGLWPDRYRERQKARLPQYVWDEENDTDLGDEIVFSDEDQRAPAR